MERPEDDGVLSGGQPSYFGRLSSPLEPPFHAPHMDQHRRFDALVAPLRDDVVSGASVLAKTAAEVLRRAAIRLQAGSLEELRWGLGEVSRKVLEAQPAMAPLLSLVRDVVVAVEGAGSLEDGRLAAAHAADAFRSAFEGRVEAVAEQALAVLRRGGLVGTISSSSTVRTALLHAAGDRSKGGADPSEPKMGAAASEHDKGAEMSRGFRVLCFESRPMNEGRSLAETLAAAGVDVDYAVDAAAYSLVPTCDVVVIGADSIGDRGVVNKIGSASVAGAARAAGVPLYALADETKILPRGFPQILDDDRPGDEVWAAPPGVRVWNRYFEVIPLQHLTGVVTERGVFSVSELEEMRSGIDAPEGLRRWMGRHQDGADESRL